MQNKKILVIDDDPLLRRLVGVTFSRVGAQVYTAANGPEGLRQLYDQRPDLIILDIMLPEKNGWRICEQILQLTDVPIILLTALGEDDQIVRGLECGAVDYVTKPFSPKVLVARAQAALRKIALASKTEEDVIYSDDYLTIDLGRRRVLVQGEPVKLSATEYKLLTYLLQHAGRLVTVEQILEEIWGWEYRDSVEYVHVYVSYLRRKLEKDPKQPQYLLTEYGVGYCFEKQAHN